MSHPVLGPGDIGALKYIITHVFCPLQLPDGDDHSIHSDHSLARSITTAARLYSAHVDRADAYRWNSILKILENLETNVQSKSMDRSQTISQFSSMDVGGRVQIFTVS